MTQTLKISLTSAMAAQIAQPGVGGYVVYFDPTDVVSGSAQAKWTALSGSTSGGTLTTLSSIPTPFSGAKFYFVIQDTLNGAKTVVTSAITTEAQIGFSGNPTTNATALNYRFDSFEASFQNKAADQGNLTNVNGFGIPMAVTVVQSSGGATTSMTRGYSATAPGSSMWTYLQSAGGVAQTFSAGGSLSGSRAIEGPSQVVSANGSGKYGASSYQASDWNYYISALISAGAMTSGNANQIQIAGYFNGANDANNIYHNAGYYSYRVTAAGSDITLTPDSTSQIKGAITLSIDDLANSIYATNGSATIAGMTGSLTSSTMNTGANNQWGAVLRDFATAFTGGYYGRLGSSLNPAVSGTINLNKEWNWDPTYAFQNNTTGTITASSGLSYNLYDPYAKVFFDNTDSYGAGYSDNLMNALTVGPLVSLASWPGVAAHSQDITVTLFGDNEAPTGYTKPAIYNYISATSYLAPEQFTGDGLNVKLFFNNGSMSLKEGTPVTLKFMSGSSAFSSVTVSSFSNFNIVSSGGGYTVSSFGSQVYGNILFNQFPISVDSTGSGVNWYQIEVGSGVAAKTFNVYLTASGTSGSAGSRQFLNPDYVTSGGFIQAGAVAADGLATILGNGDASAALTGNLTIDFAGLNALDPSLLAPFTPSQYANSAVFPIPYAPILGGRSTPGANFSGFYLPQNFSSTDSTTAQLTPASRTISSKDVYVGWYGADNAMVTSQADPGIKNFYVAAYTNKVGGQNVAKLTISGSSLPTMNHAALLITADTDGQWTTAAPIHFAGGSGTYSIVMNEYAPTDRAFSTPVTSQTAPQSFTISATADVVSSGSVTVSSGQTTSAVIFASGGAVTVNAGGVTNVVTLSSGTSAMVSSGGTAYWTFVSAGGQMYISSGATTTGTTVVSNGGEYVLAGGSAQGTDLSTHGHSYVAAGAIVSGMYVSNSGSGWISGTANGTTLAGGWQTISSGGVASNTVALAGGYANVSSGGIASGTTVSNGGAEFVGLGGIARGTVVFENGRQVVSSGGTASNTILSTHGYGYVLAGGTMSGAVVSGSGSGWIAGIAVSTTLAGGWQVISSGGVASGTQLQAGGYEAILSGGTVSGAVASTGGAEYVSSGGTLSGATLSGGQVIVSSGGIVSGTITFAGSGALILEDSDAFSGTIAGLSDAYETVHLRDMNFATVSHTYSNSGTSGTLTVTDGTDTAILALIGQYAAASFHFAADSNGGTYLWDPPTGHTPSGLVTSG